MASVIFSGDRVKTLRSALKLSEDATIFSGNINPSVTATNGEPGDVYLSTLVKSIFVKQDSGTNTNWSGFPQNNDVNFSAANSQALPTDVTGFSFDTSTIRAFESQVTISIDASVDMYEFVTIRGIQRGSDWLISQSGAGDNSGIDFSITNSGQIQYTSPTYSGFVSASIKTKSITINELYESSFAAANSQASPADVTGFAFSNITVRGFNALVSVKVDATSNLYEVFSLNGIQRGSDWLLSQSGAGDNSEFDFSITPTGQIQYTSATYSGFVNATIKFRSITVAV